MSRVEEVTHHLVNFFNSYFETLNVTFLYSHLRQRLGQVISGLQLLEPTPEVATYTGELEALIEATYFRTDEILPGIPGCVEAMVDATMRALDRDADLRYPLEHTRLVLTHLHARQIKYLRYPAYSEAICQELRKYLLPGVSWTHSVGV